MRTKSIIVLGAKVVILALILFVCYSIASVAVGLTDSAQTAFGGFAQSRDVMRNGAKDI